MGGKKLMAIVTICDICGNVVDDRDGVELTCSDWKKFGTSLGGRKIQAKRKYTAKICDKCLENIKNYCRDYRGE